MYGSINDMVARFGETEVLRLSQIEDRVTDVIDHIKVERALSDATALIDGYLRGRYQLPIKQPPADLIRACCLIARYDMAKSARSEPTEQMQKDVYGLMKWLSDIQKGNVVLDAPLLGNPASTGGFGARFKDRPAIFTSENLRGG